MNVILLRNSLDLIICFKFCEAKSERKLLNYTFPKSTVPISEYYFNMVMLGFFRLICKCSRKAGGVLFAELGKLIEVVKYLSGFEPETLRTVV